jgi:muconolactone D-isomerase
VEWLVRLDNRMGPEVPAQERDRLRTAERARAAELRAEGVLQRLWRVPGTRTAVGLFTAPDADVLHDALASLPMFAWQEITVEALATHPQER